MPARTATWRATIHAQPGLQGAADNHLVDLLGVDVRAAPRRSTASWRPNSVAVRPANAPRYLPIGVRRAARITASGWSDMCGLRLKELRARGLKRVQTFGVRQRLAVGHGFASKDPLDGQLHQLAVAGSRQIGHGHARGAGTWRGEADVRIACRISVL